MTSQLGRIKLIDNILDIPLEEFQYDDSYQTNMLQDKIRQHEITPPEITQPEITQPEITQPEIITTICPFTKIENVFITHNFFRTLFFNFSLFLNCISCLILKKIRD